MRSRRPDPLADADQLIRRVYSYVAYRVGDGPDAEDITADVFERAVRYRSSYDAKRGEPISWLIGIARRTIAGGPVRRESSAPVPDSVAPDDIESDTLRRLSIASAVQGLAIREQELIALRFGADLSAKQIGDLLDLRTNAVEVALHRALGKLRETMMVAGES